jgi:hypothetical protein
MMILCRSKETATRKERGHRCASIALLGLVVSCIGLTAAAQQMPDAPRASTSFSQSAEATGAMQATGTIIGSVTDSDGALVSGATVTLQSAGHKQYTTVSGSSGEFHFEAVPAGGFQLHIRSPGLEPATVSGALLPGAIFEVPRTSLRVATTSTEVTVSGLTQDEVATEQVHAEEQQRVLGVIPNYFVTYANHPVPLRAKQKFGLGGHVVLDPTTFLFAAAAAAIEQADNTFPGYGRGPQGYGKRYGAALADATSSTLLRGSVYPALFHQDPRYFYKGTGTVWQRARYALATAVICKGDNGRWQPNYSGILGDLSAGALSNLYYPASSRDGAALTFENGLLSTAGIGVGHLLQEFLFKRVSTHVPKAASAQP